MTQRYIIPFIPASLNRFAGRKNVWEYRDEKRRWIGLCKAYCSPAPVPPLAKASVEILFCFGNNRRRDLDNLIKPVLDGLVHAGILTDDCWQCCEIIVKGMHKKGEEKTILTISEIQ